MKRIIIVNNSNLPASIKKESIHLVRAGRCAKLSTGPIEPKPGPMFPKLVATELIVVIKSTPVNDTAIHPKTKVEM